MQHRSLEDEADGDGARTVCVTLQEHFNLAKARRATSRESGAEKPSDSLTLNALRVTQSSFEVSVNDANAPRTNNKSLCL